MAADFGSVLAERAGQLYNHCDLEGKGYITKQDMGRLVSLLPLSLDQLENVFDNLDDDGNGHLTLQEFTDGFGMFITGDAPSRKSESEAADDGKADEVMEATVCEATNFDITISRLENAGIFESTETIEEIYQRLKQTNSELIPGFETILSKFSSEVNKSKSNLKKIETTLLTKTNENDQEIHRLYDEMESQIRKEEEKILAEEQLNKKQMKEALDAELSEKQKLHEDLLKQYNTMEQRLEQLKAEKTHTDTYNEKINKSKEAVEKQLDEALLNYKDTKARLEEMQLKSKEDRKQREGAMSSVTQGLLQEQASLLTQLNALRELNKQLRDERDEGIVLQRNHEKCENSLAGEMQKCLGSGADADESGDCSAAGGMNHAGHTEAMQGEVLGEALGDYFKPNRPDSDSEEEVDGETGTNPDGSMTGSITDPNAQGTEGFSDSSLRRSKRKSKPARQVIKTQKIVKVIIPRPEKIVPEKVTCAIQSEPTPEPIRSEMEIQTEPEPEPEPEIEPQVVVPVEETPIVEEVEEENEVVDVKYEPVFSGTALPDCVYKIVLLGNVEVGKTAILNRFCNNCFRKSHHLTIGLDFQIKSVEIGDKKVALQIWDTAGQERYESITKQYYRKADGVVLVYDMMNEASYSSLKRWVSSVEENMEEENSVIMMVLANKMDCVQDGHTPATKSSTAADMAQDYGGLFFEVSAKTGENVDKAFEAMARVLKRKEDDDLRNAIRVSAALETKKKGCCGGSSSEKEKKT